MRRNGFEALGILITLTCVIGILLIIMAKVDDLGENIKQQMEQADTGQPAPRPWREPYGGCKEAAAYPGTPGYEQCAARGLVP